MKKFTVGETYIARLSNGKDVRLKCTDQEGFYDGSFYLYFESKDGYSLTVPSENIRSFCCASICNRIIKNESTEYIEVFGFSMFAEEVDNFE